MDNYAGIIPFLIDAAKKKGVRFEIDDFADEEVERKNDDLVIFRGRAAKVIDRIFEGLPSCSPGTARRYGR